VPFGLGIWEIVILAVILLLLFGGKGLPGMARRLGTGIREVKDAVEEIDPRTMLDPKDEKEAAPPKQLPPAEVVPPGERAGEAEASPQAAQEPAAQAQETQGRG
jgi:sec-independent protein translocase protein TatA